ncbi:MAG: hypothetical protein ACJAQ6_001208 [Arenicella sp.]|jgi:hypothetical protein
MAAHIPTIVFKLDDQKGVEKYRASFEKQDACINQR